MFSYEIIFVRNAIEVGITFRYAKNLCMEALLRITVMGKIMGITATAGITVIMGITVTAGITVILGITETVVITVTAVITVLVGIMVMAGITVMVGIADIVGITVMAGVTVEVISIHYLHKITVGF